MVEQIRCALRRRPQANTRQAAAPARVGRLALRSFCLLSVLAGTTPHLPCGEPAPPAVPAPKDQTTGPEPAEGGATTPGFETPGSAPPPPGGYQGAFQQFQQFAPPAPLATPQPRAAPVAAETTGLVLGNLVLRPSCSLTLGYDDNVYGTTSRQQQGDVISESSAGLGLTYTPAAEFSVVASYAFGWDHYVKGVAKDYPTHNGGISLQWGRAGITGLSVSLADVYSQTGDIGRIDQINRSGNPNAPQERFQRFTRVQGNNAGPTITYQATRWSLTTTYQYGISDYLSGIQRGNGDTSHMVSSLFTYRLTDAGLTAFGNYFFDHRVPKVGPGTDLHSFTAGIRGTARMLAFEGSLGYDRNISLPSGLISQDYTVSARLGYQPVTSVGVFLTARHNSNITVQGGSTRKYDFSTGARLALATRYAVVPSVTYSLENRSDGLSISELGYRCRASYTLLQYVDGFLSAERVEESSSLGVRVTDNRLQMGVFVRF